MHRWTDEEKEFLKQNVEGTPIHELTKMFNAEFNTDLRYEQVRGTVKRMKLRCGVTTQFKKGHITWNKGVPIYNKKCEKTQFKKGHVPKTYLPVGAVRINKDGYKMIKVSDEGGYSDRWKLKHRVMWERENGKIPHGYNLMFLDGNKLNDSMDNLILIKRCELSRLNKQKLIKDDPEFTKVGVNIVRIQQKVHDLQDNSKKKGE
ncbi:HNH endonuclease [Staphylococcus sp. 18_1_E_LY]|uniref:HNH endonuclease n=1 Tax=Staphylococcus lloydii TaxID=2781774 RepID=A0A7T1F8W3_9STAP|nr:HNH endonuclease signature motif containing protein [Staphylococcus lloydii]MBF7019236.1 HNH endonuclease [Staphylococcus lloydii]MBF7026964.1 HNH endonuclease [Staphylococcus lloydii]QPM74612.1 HNH endonuclease [Staphylococcus lloydii]